MRWRENDEEVEGRNEEEEEGRNEEEEEGHTTTTTMPRATPLQRGPHVTTAATTTAMTTTMRNSHKVPQPNTSLPYFPCERPVDTQARESQ